MAGKSSGGRPQNAWTNSRRRKLARLYTLTDLSTAEIQEVLRSDGFNPKSRDIQKKLRSLFHKDYIKNYRAYRPQNEEQMKIRSSVIQRIKRNRVSKTRRFSQTHAQARPKGIASRPNSSAAGTFEGPANAFRNYSSPDVPLWLPRDGRSPDSQVVNSFRLMLDGSELATQLPSCDQDQSHFHKCCATCGNRFRQCPIEGGQALNNGICMPLNTSVSTPVNGQLCQDRRQHEDRNRTHIEEYHSNTEHFTDCGVRLPDIVNKPIDIFPRPPTSTGAPSEPGVPTPSQSLTENLTHSIATLSRQLSTRLPTHIQHVYSVLRCSFTDSSRSSFSTGRISISSWRSSRISLSSAKPKFSKASNPNQTPQISPLYQARGNLIDSKTQVIERVKEFFSKGERDIWKEVLEPIPILQRPPRPSSVGSGEKSLIHRSCCSLADRPNVCCYYCGFAPTHAWARSGSDWNTFPLIWDINQSDHFGNTSLHFAAASGKASLASILAMFDKGANCKAKNTSGETFLHVLNLSNFSVANDEGIVEYILLLRRLKDVGYPFSAQNCHGQSVAHITLKNWDDAFSKLGLLRQNTLTSNPIEALQLMNANINALDNYGNCPGDFWRWYKGVARSYVHNITDELGYSMNMPSLFPKPPQGFLSFRETLSSPSWKATTWLEYFNRPEYLSWVDMHGDTPLTAVLKWRDEDEELEIKNSILQLISKGAMVDLRDRKGNTALAIAALRGSRPSVQALLDSGAQPNSRNYQQVGIISRALKRMSLAQREGKDECYARIMSCINLLVEHGAKLEPTERDEWLLASARNIDISIGEVKNPSAAEYGKFRFS
ncbi:hypothetical protein G7Y89_g3324 [Cudoniella acicularis]|uniref:Clr5 domain-containing protein n=1 Tax=Cudoniella acicularis TaxID=354080 RepID=A0A8H4W636_9HELO|nr:hypothetical protein G7Y89_g3324 [Cudoniella acicularis]